MVLIERCFVFFYQAFGACLGWFTRFATHINFVHYLATAFLIFTVIRVLISPLIGAGISDTVRPKRDRSSSAPYDRDIMNSDYYKF